MVLSTNRSAVILLGICAQVLVTAIFLWRVEPYIENRLERDGKNALQDASLTWARVDADGRDVQISGMAPTQRLKERAVGLVESVPGIRRVTDKLLVASAKAPSLAPEEAERRAKELLSDIEDDAPIFTLDLPYELHLQVEASVVTLSGLVPDEVAKDSLLNLANREFGDGRIIDRLMVAPGAPENYLAASTNAIAAAGEINRGIVMVTDREVIVQGMSSNGLSVAKLGQLFTKLPADYTGNVQVGDQRELESLLRIHPSLAERVGRVSRAPQNETTITPVQAPVSPSTSDSNNPEPENNTRFDAQTQVSEVTQSLSSTECADQLQTELARQGIGFDTGSSDIAQASQPLMQELVRIAKRCPQVILEIAGHTDDLGTRQNNLALSQRRAESVMEYLVRNGVALNRLRAVGYGEERPLVENTTAERRKMNRRIEFSLVDES